MILALVEAQQHLNFTDISGKREKRGDQSKTPLALHIDWVERGKKDMSKIT